METKQLIKTFKKHKLAILIWAVLGSLLGVLFFYSPSKFVSTGSFFITRTADNSGGFFTYEGYYSQQTALSYTNTVAGLLESVDLQSMALSALGQPVNEINLWKFARYAQVKKSGPQLITLSVKGNTLSQARNAWEALGKALITTTTEINSTGDSKLTIMQVSDQPVVKPEFKSLLINIPVGIIFGLLIGFLAAALKEYE